MRDMKDSGVEWIGEIPGDWKVCKIKNIAQIYTGNSIRDEEKGRYENSDNARPYIATKDIDVTLGTTNYENGLYIKKNDLSFKVAYKGSTLMCIEGGSAGKKKTYLLHNVSFGNKLCCFYSEIINKTYLYFFLSSPNFEMEFANCISGLIGGVSVSVLKNMAFLIPSKENQQCIANMLKDKCSKIDAIIIREQAVIEKLKEYKLSVITEAVTKGLNLESPMKDSGVEWIGEIPEEWSTIKLKNAAGIMRGKFSHRPRNDPDYYDGDYPFVQTGDVARADKYVSSYTQTLNELGYSVSKEFPKGSIIMTIAANVGDVAVLSFDACFPDSVVGFIPNSNIHWNYLFYVLKAMKNQLMRNAIISTQMNLNIEIIKVETVPIVPYEEQLSIVKFLDEKSENINHAIACKQTLITKLTEYKKSFIYEVVTGKKEV